MFTPDYDQMIQISKMIKMSDASRQGFIISLQKYADAYADIEGMAIENLILSDWVPQREILNHEKTKLFLTHCGANGVIEAMYYGVAMLGFPVIDE
jgi:UDP:flavonoid glycosyltransferase YjiC (YdhE family)